MIDRRHSAVYGNVTPEFGRYEPFLKIGSGGMARVYLAMQRGPFDARKLVVIKQLRQEIVDDEQMLAMFVDEARIALRLSHPNVVHTYEIVAEAPEYYMAMEFLEGHSLLSVLRRLGRSNVPLEEHIWILTQVLAGLHYAHALRDFDGSLLGIVHRDVSPANVVVCFNGDVKLVDFGIAKAAGALATTQHGVMKGKLGYMAPEQCLGNPADPRSDVYAVGVMLWEAMARRSRSAGENWPAMLRARVTDGEPAVEEVWPEAPAELVAISHRALEWDPAARYATAREFQSDLEQFLRSGPRKIGPESVAELLRPHFQSARQELQRAIEAHLAGASPAVTNITATRSNLSGAAGRLSTLNTKGRLSWQDEVKAPADIPSVNAILLSSKVDIPIHAAPAPQPASIAAKSKGWLVPIAIAGAATLAATAVFGLSRWNAAPVRTTLPVNTAKRPADVPAPFPATARIVLRIAATPDRAELWLDGRPLGQNPYLGTFEPDGQRHELRVTAPNFREQRRTLQLERDIELSLALTPEPGASRPARRPLPSRGAASAAPQPLPERHNAEPGMELGRRSESKRKSELDENDPYLP